MLGSQVRAMLLPVAVATRNSGAGATTVMLKVSMATRFTTGPLSVAWILVWYGAKRTCEQLASQSKMAVTGESSTNWVIDAGELVTSKGPPYPVMFINPPKGSLASMTMLKVCPASIQVSGKAFNSGGRLSHTFTKICMSRKIEPNKIPSLHSSIRIARLYSPVCCGLIQLTVPVMGSIEIWFSGSGKMGYRFGSA